MRIVFCGTGEIGLPAFRALAEAASHDIVAVITQPDRPAGRDLRPKASAIKQEGLARGFVVHQPEKIRQPDFVAHLRELRPDVMMVAAYGQLLPKSVLEIPVFGCLNIHASLLPRHRGASPIQAAILDGDPETGITIMAMDEGLDTGDILLQNSTPILPGETAGQLHDRLAVLAAPLALQALENLKTLPRHPQDSLLATHAPKLRKTDGLLDWSRPARELVLQILAMNPWPGAYTHLQDGTLLKIHRATEVAFDGSPGAVIGTDAGRPIIGTGNGSLALEELQAVGKKRLSAPDFLRGFPLPTGTVLGGISR